MPRARPWTEYEKLILRKALREGGYPLAEQRLPRRTRAAIRIWAARNGLSPTEEPRIDLLTTAEIGLMLDVSPQAALKALGRVSLRVRRGKHALGLRCQMQALLSQRPPPIEAVERPGLLSIERAAERLHISVSHFKDHFAPRVMSRIPVRNETGQTTYLYPLDDVLALRAS